MDIVDLDSDDSSGDYEILSSETEDEDISKREDDARVTKKSTLSFVDEEKLIQLVQDCDTKSIKVDVFKSYLRKRGLRLKGNKAELINRIKQHVELKEAHGRVPGKYAPVTFTISCKGDVCKGDVVMFVQAVHEKMFVRVGSRTVAGKVVNENYGARCQQHTFTIEVYWSTGCRRKAPMEQLIIKGRNLYKKKILRQKWDDEDERKKILDEKHRRGAIARCTRATNKGGGRHPELPSSRNGKTVAVSQQQILSRQTSLYQGKTQGSCDSLVIKQHRQWSRNATELLPASNSKGFSKKDRNSRVQKIVTSKQIMGVSKKRQPDLASTSGLRNSFMHSGAISLPRDGLTSPHRTKAIFPSSLHKSRSSRAKSPYQTRSSSSRSRHSITSSPYGIQQQSLAGHKSSISRRFSDPHLRCSGPYCAAQASPNCSNRLCYHCCRKKGEYCQKHRRERGKPL